MSARLPLAGLRVVDCSRVLAGPWATQLLGDLGAEVWKIERPGRGDDTRQWGPPFLPARPRDAAYFACANRSKRSLAIDFSRPAGAALVRDLVARADVFVENFKVGGLARYGLDFDSLAAVQPKLAYCSITGFGQTGPRASEPGYDFVVQAMSGLMDITGEPDRAPQKVGVAVCDILTGLYASTAILAVLRSGRAQHIDLALFDVAVASLANQASAYLASGESPRRRGNAHPSIVPYDVVPSRDGHFVLACGNDGQFRSACGVLAMPDTADDPRFATNAARVEHRDLLMDRIGAQTRTLPSAHWLAALAKAGVPAAPVNTIAEAFADPQTVARGAIVDQDGIRTVANPIRLVGDVRNEALPPPEVGADTAAVLRDVLSLRDDEIAGLENEQII